MEILSKHYCICLYFRLYFFLSLRFWVPLLVLPLFSAWLLFHLILCCQVLLPQLVAYFSNILSGSISLRMLWTVCFNKKDCFHFVSIVLAVAIWIKVFCNLTITIKYNFKYRHRTTDRITIFVSNTSSPSRSRNKAW